MEHGEIPSPKTASPIGRRRLLAGAAVAGAAIGGGALAGTAAASASSNLNVRRETMTFEVACLGHTLREQRYPDPPEPNDLRGTPTAVEGWIYPAGTIPGDGFVATEDVAIGRWFCAGFNIQHGERPEPHLNAMATFVFGAISESNLFPPDTLVTSGLGGTFDDGADSLRPVIGGSGQYFGVIGQAGRVNHGTNNTVLFGPGVPAPNFVYTFDLLYLV